MLAGEGIRVVPVRKQYYFHVQAFPKHVVHNLEGGVDAGGIPVEHHGEVLGELMDKMHLLRGEGSSAGSHHVGDAELVHHDHIQIPLHHYAFVLAADFAFRLIQTVEDLALGIKRGVRRIHVLGRIVRPEGTSAESDDPSAHRINREHYPFPEFIYEGTVFFLRQQTCLQKIFFLISCLFCSLHECGAAGRRPSEGKIADGRILKAAALVVGISHGTAFRRGKLVNEELGGILACKKQALFPLPGLHHFRRLLLFAYFDIVFPGEIAQRLRIVAMLLLHYESHRRSGLSAPEAFVDAFRRGHIKGRCLLIMEGTAGHIARTAALKRHVITDNLFYFRGIEYEIDCLLGYHSAISQRNCILTRRISISSQSPLNAFMASSRESEEASLRK